KFIGDESATSSPVDVNNACQSVDEQRRAFHTQPVWKRAATVFAGPAFNIILTVVISSVFFALYGRQISDPLIAGVQPGSPAAEAGFEAGDRFISVDGEKITTFSDVQRIVSGRAGDTLNFTVERDGKMVDLQAVPAIVERTDPLGNRIKLGAIGVETTEAVGNSAGLNMARSNQWHKLSWKRAILLVAPESFFSALRSVVRINASLVGRPRLPIWLARQQARDLIGSSS